MTLASLYTLSLIALLILCAAYMASRKTREDAESDGADGDYPFISADDLKTLFHDPLTTGDSQHGRS